MCGICGFLDPGGMLSGNDLLPAVRGMTSAIAHRGPDEERFWCDPERGIALGHRRLSIIDLTPTGRQPMESFCGRYVIVLNGEIYNFRDIRKNLEEQGVSFKGTSDTEVLLAAISLWGLEKALERSVGMFAFALWDKRECLLTLARDRMGEKPLYYGKMGSSFLFGSELKAMKAHPSWQGTIHRESLSLFLRHNYISAPYSIYEGVFKLLPGTYLQIPGNSLQRGEPLPESRRYWSLYEKMAEGVAHPVCESEEKLAIRLEDLLRESIRGQMISDVPLGAFLSGGIDSSTVVALMQSLSSRPVKTFTIGFHEDAYNEAEHAKAVARHLGTDHTELYITPLETLGVIPKLPTLYDEPFGDSSQIPTFLVSQLARQHVTVSLSGDAGDELFAGYGRYVVARALWQKVSKVPLGVRKKFGVFFPSCKMPFFCRGKRARRIEKMLSMLQCDSREAFYGAFVSHCADSSFYVCGNVDPLPIFSKEQILPGADFIAQMQYMDMMSYLPDDILVKVDRAAMGVSLESRAPFLDHRIVEFASGLPLSSKMDTQKGKKILRNVLYKHIPADLIERPKRGFSVPLEEWLRGPLREWGCDLLNPSIMLRDGLLNAQAVRKKWDDHISGRANFDGFLWNVLMFQAWREKNPN